MRQRRVSRSDWGDQVEILIKVNAALQARPMDELTKAKQYITGHALTWALFVQLQ